MGIQEIGSAMTMPWKAVESASQLFIELQDLGLKAYMTYTLMLRATNYALFTSDVIASNFTIETEAPRVSSEYSLHHYTVIIIVVIKK